MINIKNILIAVCSLFFFMIGADKFFAFLKPPCSLMGDIPEMIWYVLGALQIVSGILIWMPKFRNFITGFFTVFMLIFTIVHLTQNTSDFGGSLFMAFLLALIRWNPPFIRGRNAES